jgi:hypothetical protein
MEVANGGADIEANTVGGLRVDDAQRPPQADIIIQLDKFLGSFTSVTNVIA